MKSMYHRRLFQELEERLLFPGFLRLTHNTCKKDKKRHAYNRYVMRESDQLSQPGIQTKDD